VNHLYKYLQVIVELQDIYLDFGEFRKFNLSKLFCIKWNKKWNSANGLFYILPGYFLCWKHKSDVNGFFYKKTHYVIKRIESKCEKNSNSYIYGEDIWNMGD